MKKVLLAIVICLFLNNYYKGDADLKDIGQKETILISGKAMEKEILDKLIDKIKEYLEEVHYWGRYEINEEVRMKIIYSYVDLFEKNCLLVLIENPKNEIELGIKEKRIRIATISEEGVILRDYIYFLREHNTTILKNEKDEDIGPKFFEQGAIETTIRIEGTYSIPPVKIVTEENKREVEYGKQFIKEFIKERKWEGKFSTKKVNMWMDLSEEPMSVRSFIIENEEGWGFFGNMSFSESKQKFELIDGGAFRSEIYSKPEPYHIKRMKEYFLKMTIELGRQNSR